MNEEKQNPQPAYPVGGNDARFGGNFGWYGQGNNILEGSNFPHQPSSGGSATDGLVSLLFVAAAFFGFFTLPLVFGGLFWLLGALMFGTSGAFLSAWGVFAGFGLWLWLMIRWVRGKKSRKLAEPHRRKS